VADRIEIFVTQLLQADRRLQQEMVELALNGHPCSHLLSKVRDLWLIVNVQANKVN